MSESGSDIEEDTVEYFEDSNSEGVDQLCLYGNEPEYNDDEIQNIDDSSGETDDSEEEMQLDSSRLENLHWCTCKNCGIMPTLVESKCCKEFRGMLGDKLETCITLNPHFPDMCLKKHILDAAYIQNRRYHGKFTDIKLISNKNYRFTAYRQYTAWVHYFERLGRGNRVCIPACVVQKIRETFPSEDGVYTGFKGVDFTN